MSAFACQPVTKQLSLKSITYQSLTDKVPFCTLTLTLPKSCLF